MLVPLLLIENFLHIFAHFNDLVVFQVKLLKLVLVRMLHESHAGLVVRLLVQVAEDVFGARLAEASRAEAVGPVHPRILIRRNELRGRQIAL